MKKFVWPLQRLLDVTKKREQAMKSELVALNQRIVRLGQEIESCHADIQRMIQEISRQPIEVRMTYAQQVAAYTTVIERRAASLGLDRSKLNEEKTQKTEQLMKVRASREAMEKMRNIALTEYRRQAVVAEQKQLDESAQIGFARRLGNSRA